jgi:hypothetical protein
MPKPQHINPLLLLCALLVGCAGPSTQVAVKMDPREFQPAQTDFATHARVEVVDVRHEIRAERTTVGNISLGTVSFLPPEAELVKAMLQPRVDARLAAIGAADPLPTVYCGIQAFDVETPATALYWDAKSRVQLLLRVGKTDRTISGEGAERTYAWPSAEVIRRTTNEALRQAGAQAEAALNELLPAEGR